MISMEILKIWKLEKFTNQRLGIKTKQRYSNPTSLKKHYLLIASDMFLWCLFIYCIF